MNNWYTIRAQSTGAEVVIYDEIGAYGVSAKGFLAELGALPDATPLAQGQHLLPQCPRLHSQHHRPHSPPAQAVHC